MLIIRKSKLYYTASGIITPVGGLPVHRLRADSVRNESGLSPKAYNKLIIKEEEK
jgi:hypothetical protein